MPAWPLQTGQNPGEETVQEGPLLETMEAAPVSGHRAAVWEEGRALSRLTTSGDGRRQVTLPTFLILFVNFFTSK